MDYVEIYQRIQFELYLSRVCMQSYALCINFDRFVDCCSKLGVNHPFLIVV